MSGPAPDVVLAGISKRFGEIVALDSAHLRLTPGTVHALLGENGAGKTTLMRIAFGMLKPDAGSLQLNGTATSFRSSADAIRNGIRMVHQHSALVPELSAVENFALGGHGLYSPALEAQRLANCSAELGNSLDPARRVSSMSAAEQQHLEIAKALGEDCRILILDEPTASLAPAQADALLSWTRRFVETGRSVVLITHKLRDAFAVADEVTVLRHGRTVLSAHLRAIAENDLLGAMLGPEPASAISAARGGVVPGRLTVASLRAVSAEDHLRREYMHDVSLEVMQGEVLGIAGLEQSGHHLLLRVLAGRRWPTSGSAQLPTAIAFIPEDVRREGIAGSMDLRANIAIRGASERRGWMRRAHWTNQARRLMHEFDVRAANERVPVETLSGGNQQRLVLARELSGNPALIVAENPTHGLDARAAEDVRRRLHAARNRGAAVVFYSSDLDELLSQSDRVLVMYAGRLTLVERSQSDIGRALLGGA